MRWGSGYRWGKRTGGAEAPFEEGAGAWKAPAPSVKCNGKSKNEKQVLRCAQDDKFESGARTNNSSVIASGLDVGGLVADVGSADPEDDVFGDVGGVVAYALKVAGDDQRVQGLWGHFGALADEGA